MNLIKLFEMQKVLDDRIIKEHGLEGQDLLPKKILALQVELGECANEWRGFKMWSKDQEPRTKREHLCSICDGTGDENYQSNLEDRLEGRDGYPYLKCEDCNGTGKLAESNPLLEEYVDCLHFILSIGLSDPLLCVHDWNYTPRKDETVIKQFNSTFFHLAIFSESYASWDYEAVLTFILGLGEMLGFTWEQIETAYMDKNSVNHDRQTNGY